LAQSISHHLPHDPPAPLGRSRTGCVAIRTIAISTCNVTAKEDPVLRKWIGSQRTKKKNGKLSAKQIDLLHKIGFEWEIRKCEAKSDSE
jgi:hypothetical protein